MSHILSAEEVSQIPDQTNAVCIAAMGTLTLSLKAMHALRDAGVNAEAVSLMRNETRQGCAYGVAFPCPDKHRCRSVLNAAHLSPTQYIERKPSP